MFSFLFILRFFAYLPTVDTLQFTSVFIDYKLFRSHNTDVRVRICTNSTWRIRRPENLRILPIHLRNTALKKYGRNVTIQLSVWRKSLSPNSHWGKKKWWFRSAKSGYGSAIRNLNTGKSIRKSKLTKTVMITFELSLTHLKVKSLDL